VLMKMKFSRGAWQSQGSTSASKNGVKVLRWEVCASVGDQDICSGQLGDKVLVSQVTGHISQSHSC
jgi:hypothetical protein